MDPQRLPDPHVGVFDSGVGGLSVLRALVGDGPQAPFHYVADTAFAPYGERAPREIVQRARHLACRLVDEGADMVVIACNTATALAIDDLRAQWPAVQFVGIEPAVKPAMAVTRNGRVGVMATAATLASARLRDLVQRHAGGAHVFLQPCPGLATAIETDDAALEDIARRHVAPLTAACVDTVVLGCTHYPLAREVLQRCLGDHVSLLDPAQAVAARARTLWPHPPVPAALRLSATGHERSLVRAASRWLGAAAPAAHLSV
jgi:glutamate racemase